MAKQAPDPIDVQDFQFKLQCRLKVFANEDSSVFDKPCNLVAAASRFGLIFIGATSPEFQVVQLDTIERHDIKDGEITDYPRRIVSLPSRPKHLSVNCDCTKLAVVVEQNNCPVALIYDVISMLKQELSAPMEIRLSPTPGVSVTETSWNPTIPNIYTACKNDGTLGLYEMKETGIDINELPADSQASCMCWSPKGKQIAVGSRNGKITQYKPDLKAVKVINAPPLDGSPSIIALQWISNYQFIGLYKPQNPESGASLIVIDAPKTGDTIYTNYDDICYSYGNTRPYQFYTVFQSNWNVLMVASSNSMEVGVIGSDGNNWMLWALADSARAELPLSSKHQDTLPVGLVFDIGATQPVIWGEISLPPAPYLLLLSHHGLLCCFKVLNLKNGAPSICQPREVLPDTSGLNQFTTISKLVSPVKVPTLEPQKQPTSFLEQPIKPISLQIPTPQTSSIFTAPKTQPSTLFPPPSFGTPFSMATIPTTITMPVNQPASQPISQPVSITVQSTPTTPPQSLQHTVQSLQGPTITSLTNASQMVIPQSSDTNIVQEDADVLISKLIREECETLETELKALLHKGQSIKINLGTDTEAVNLVKGADALEEFIKEMNETSSGQDAEVHSLKQALIQTWAWYEDARSRIAQIQDVALETLLRIQKLDPVSQRYSADIKYMCYYLNSQIMQAQRTLDEQWENFRDSCKKIVKMKIPTMEAIYQTMVRQNAVQQKQQYVLKDISRRVRSQRSKINGPSLLLSINNADQLEKELERLQLEPQHILQAQYERVLQNQKRLTTNKVQKLSKLILDKEVIRVTHTKPKLSNTPLQLSLRKANTTMVKPQAIPESSFLVGSLSPITTGKHPYPKVVDFIQSTPITPSEVIPKQSTENFKSSLSSLSMKFSPEVTSAPTVFGKTQSVVTTTSSSVQFSFSAVTSAPTFSPNTSTVEQIKIGPANITSKPSTVPISFNTTPKSIIETSGTNTNSFAAKSAVSFNSTKPSTFSFSFATTTPSTTAKPLTNTTNSAFVPTTAPPFNFNIKTPISSSGSFSMNATSKGQTFVFGKTASVFGSPKSDSDSGISSSESAISSVPSTTTVTIVTSSLTTPAGLFSAPKTTISIGTSSTTAVTSSSGLLFKPPVVSSTATTSVPSSTNVFQTILAPRTSITTTVSSSITQGTTVSAISSILTATTKSSTVSVLPNQGLPTATQAGSAFSFTLKPVAVASNTTNNITSTTSEKESLATKEALTSGSIFNSGSTTGLLFENNSTSLSSTAPTTTSTSLFGASITKSSGSLFNVPVASTSATLFSSPTTATLATTSVSIFSSPTTSTSIFGAATTTSTSAPSLATTTVTPVTTTTTAAADGSSSGSLFSTTSTTSSIFGTAAVTTTTSSLFGTTDTTSGSLFDAGSLFGTSTTTVAKPLFGASTTTTSSSLFSTTATSTTGSLFAAATPATTSTSAFAGGSQPQQEPPSNGTTSTTPAFNTTDTITTTTTTTTVPSVFASPISTSAATPTSTTSSSNFPVASTTSSFSFATTTTTASTAFKTPATTTPSIFGGTPTTSIFGSSGFGTTTTASSAFGSSAPFGSTSPFTSNAGSVFGGSNAFGTTTTASTPAFAQPAAFASSSVFGAPPASTSANAFGSGFSSNNSLFGTATTTQSSFGQSPSSTFSFATAAANVPQNSNSGFGFSNKPSAFGFGGATSPTSDTNSFSFGNLNVGSSNTNSGFGSAFGQSANANPFVKAAAQEQKPAFGGGSLFGTPSTTSSASIFGGGSNSSFGGGNTSFGSSSGFGSSSFGQQQAFSPSPGFGSSSSFGNPSQTAGPFSGGSQSVAQTGFGGFGQSPKPAGFGAAPVFSGSPTGFGSPPSFGGGSSPGFGATPSFGSPAKMFGSPSSPTGTFGGGAAQPENPTFANLATQNTLGFGSLAQQSSQPNSSMSSFGGGSSFSTWR